MKNWRYRGYIKIMNKKDKARKDLKSSLQEKHGPSFRMEKWKNRRIFADVCEVGCGFLMKTSGARQS